MHRNPYWQAVVDHVEIDWRGRPAVLCVTLSDRAEWRRYLIERYAFTITAPATVAFVAEQAGPRVVDPMAGTGYWAWQLQQAGCDVVAADTAPPSTGRNEFHVYGDEYVPVAAGDAADVAAAHPQHTLLLSWPPFDVPDGDRALAAYTGNRVVYIGEECCGDDALYRRLARDWAPVETHGPVHWEPVKDMVTLYTRTTKGRRC